MVLGNQASTVSIHSVPNPESILTCFPETVPKSIKHVLPIFPHIRAARPPPNRPCTMHDHAHLQRKLQQRRVKRVHAAHILRLPLMHSLAHHSKALNLERKLSFPSNLDEAQAHDALAHLIEDDRHARAGDIVHALRGVLEEDGIGGHVKWARVVVGLVCARG